MNIGELRHKITFQKLKNNVPNENGNENGFESLEDDQYEDFKTIFSAVYPLKGQEFWSAKALRSETTVKFICRYLPGILTSMRLVYNTRKFNIIEAIDIDEKHQWLQIMALEVI